MKETSSDHILHVVSETDAYTNNTVTKI